MSNCRTSVETCRQIFWLGNLWKVSCLRPCPWDWGHPVGCWPMPLAFLVFLFCTSVPQKEVVLCRLTDDIASLASGSILHYIKRKIELGEGHFVRGSFGLPHSYWGELAAYFSSRPFWRYDWWRSFTTSVSGMGYWTVASQANHFWWVPTIVLKIDADFGCNGSLHLYQLSSFELVKLFVLASLIIKAPQASIRPTILELSYEAQHTKWRERSLLHQSSLYMPM